MPTSLTPLPRPAADGGGTAGGRGPLSISSSVSHRRLSAPSPQRQVFFRLWLASCFICFLVPESGVRIRPVLCLELLCSVTFAHLEYFCPGPTRLRRPRSWTLRPGCRHVTTTVVPDCCCRPVAQLFPPRLLSPRGASEASADTTGGVSAAPDPKSTEG